LLGYIPNFKQSDLQAYIISEMSTSEYRPGISPQLRI